MSAEHSDVQSSRLLAPWPASSDILFAVSCLAALLAAGAFISSASASPRATHLVLAAAVGLCLALTLARAARDRSAILLVGFTCIYCLFHFGAVAGFILPMEARNLQPEWVPWKINTDLARQAYVAALAFLGGLAAACFVPMRLTAPPTARAGQSRHIETVTLTGLVGAVIVWVLLVKVSFDVRNYTDYLLTARASSTFTLAVTVLHPLIVSLFVLGCLWSTRIWPLFTVFVLWTAIALPLGLRSHVLMPMILALLCLHVRGTMRIPWISGLAGGTVLLLAISFVREYRMGGVTAGEAWQSSSILRAVAEMGVSIRPMFEVIRWLEISIDSLRWGETYWAPFERTIARLLTLERVDGLDDLRLMNVAIAQRAGNYGFSISAEAMINFGLIGCAAIGLLVGLLLLGSGRRIASGSASVPAVALLCGLFFHIRQSFVGAYAIFVCCLVVGLAILVAVWALDRLRPCRTTPDATGTQ